MLPESQRWAGPLGIPSRTQTNIMAPSLSDKLATNPAPDAQPPTAERSAVDMKLKYAARVLSREGGPGPACQTLAPGYRTASSRSSFLQNDFRQSGLDEASARDAAAFAGAALLAAVGDKGGRDVLTWQDLCSGVDHESLTDEARRLVDNAQRAFASNGPAFDALWHMMTSRGHPVATDPINKVAFRQALQAVDTLIDLGAIDREADLDWKAVACQAKQRRPELLAVRLGGSEAKESLAWMTLLHAEHRLSGADGPAPAALRAASMAWRNGFTTSGEGTDFNRTAHRMHKFATWVNRAVQSKPQAQAPGVWAQRTMGKQLSPLLAMRHGLLGGDLGDIATEAERLVRYTQEALAAVRDAVQAAATANVDGESEALLRSKLAVLDHWISLGDGLQDGAELDAAQRSQVAASLHGSPSARPTRAAAQADVLGARFSLDLLERWARSPDIAPHDTDALHQHLDRLHRTAKPSQAVKVVDPDRVALLDLAKRALDTEGVQWQHGGTLGFEPVANLGFLNGGLAFSGAGATVRLSRGRAVTMRIGASTVGSDIFFGTGTKLTSGAAAFGYAGLAPNEMLKVGLVGRLTYRREAGEQTGVSLRVSKSVPDHKSQCARVIEFLFAAAESAACEPIDAPALWQHFADTFFDSDVSVNFVEAESVTRRKAAAVSLGARLVLPLQSMGPSLQLGYESTTRQARRVETTGHATSAAAVDRQNANLTTQATLGWNPIPGVTIDGEKLVDRVGVASLPLLGCRADFALPSSSAGQIRLTMENGRVVPALSLQQREFKSQDEFMGHVQHRRAQWEAALGGPGKFEQTMAEVRSLSLPPHKTAGNRWFTERSQLTPGAAARLSLLHAQRTLGFKDAGVDAAGRAKEIDSAIEAELNDSSNWQPEKLAVFEVARAQDTLGPGFVLVANTTLQATSVTRYLYQAKANSPDTAVAADPIAAPPSVADVAQSPAKVSRVDVSREVPGTRYVGSLVRALARALPATDGPDSNADAFTVFSAMREARLTALDAIQVLASIKSQRPGASTAIDIARIALEARLEQTDAGRAALARLKAKAQEPGTAVTAVPTLPR